jgi:hypothetical protein
MYSLSVCCHTSRNTGQTVITKLETKFVILSFAILLLYSSRESACNKYLMFYNTYVLAKFQKFVTKYCCEVTQRNIDLHAEFRYDCSTGYRDMPFLSEG